MANEPSDKPTGIDQPIAPGQEEWERRFVRLRDVVDGHVDAHDLLRWLAILRAYYHAEAWELVAHDIEFDDDDTQWRRGEGVVARCHSESWRRKAEKLAK